MNTEESNNMIKIAGIKVTDRIKEIGLTQEILTRYSSIITTRLGFHELTTDVCSREAYIILHLSGEGTETDRLISDLLSVGGIEVRMMDFYDIDTSDESDNKGSTIIFGLLIEKDHDTVIAVQKLLSSYGCIIRSRLGVNEMFYGKPAGLILLELAGDREQIMLLESDLRKFKKLHFRKMVF